uniref:CASTOR1 N-terminal domain-containing protein n=34 Tax=Neognathae TaxID=8825 RepID=A0A803Y8W4_MELGA
MELHILEHRLRVASIAKESIQLFTYGLIKLAFLSSKTR